MHKISEGQKIPLCREEKLVERLIIEVTLLQLWQQPNSLFVMSHFTLRRKHSHRV